MKEFLIGLAIASIIATTLISLPESDGSKYLALFSNWKKENNRQYNGAEEEAYREKIFYENLKKIKMHNADKSQSYTMGVNQFMDLTPDEFKAYYLSSLILHKKTADIRLPPKPMPPIKRPDTWDWRTTAGVIRKVKDQKSCGSCWAFSATGALEGLAKIKKGIDDEFSEQQLVDCSWDYGNEGCNGGWMDSAFQYVRDKGITTEGDYPYVGRDQSCKKQGGAFKITGYTDIPAGNIDVQADTVCSQPISIAADASNWSFYSGGIFSNCGTSLNHGIMLVGYDPQAWFVKNSWGSRWGEKGYIRLKRGNTCGCANASSYPTL